MRGPLPKPSTLRQRRNRSSSIATLESEPAQYVDLPQRFSPFRCVVVIDRKRGCRLPGEHHDLEHFAKAEVEPHDFKPSPIDYHPETIRWWSTIWDSPMAKEWVDGDVPGLLILAGLVERYWTTGDPKVAGEIRMQGREYGLSPMARRSLQWEIARAEDATRRTASRTPPTKPVADPRSALKAVK